LAVTLTHNPYLRAEGIALDPGALDAEQLKQQAWVALEPAYLRRTEALSQDFHAGRAKGLGSDDLDDTLQAAVAGRVGTLLVAAERHIAGRLDVAAMKVVREDDFVDPATGDVLDDLVELVVRHGGKAVVVPEARMPTQTGIAATYRY
jgi:hypothetical protein